MTNFRKPKECVNMPCMYKVHVKEQSGGIGGEGVGEQKISSCNCGFQMTDPDIHTNPFLGLFMTC